LIVSVPVPVNVSAVADSLTELALAVVVTSAVMQFGALV
jgi:hypothetical protein